MTELIALFWIADVMNLPFMEIFDVAYPLNGWFWFWGWCMILAIRESYNK